MVVIVSLRMAIQNAYTAVHDMISIYYYYYYYY